jgi:hypothetical protein
LVLEYIPLMEYTGPRWLGASSTLTNSRSDSAISAKPSRTTWLLLIEQGRNCHFPIP